MIDAHCCKQLYPVVLIANTWAAKKYATLNVCTEAIEMFAPSALLSAFPSMSVSHSSCSSQNFVYSSLESKAVFYVQINRSQRIRSSIDWIELSDSYDRYLSFQLTAQRRWYADADEDVLWSVLRDLLPFLSPQKERRRVQRSKHSSIEELCLPVKWSANINALNARKEQKTERTFRWLRSNNFHHQNHCTSNNFCSQLFISSNKIHSISDLISETNPFQVFNLEQI